MLAGKKFLLLFLTILYFVFCNTQNSFFFIAFFLGIFILYLSTRFFLSDLDNSKRQTLFFLAAIHFLITVSMVFYMPPIIAGDAGHYWELGLKHLIFMVKYNPAYSIIVQIFKQIHNNAVPADFTLFQSLISAFNVLLFFHIGNKLHSKKMGMIAAVMAAFWIPFIEFSSCSVVTETFSVTIGIIIISKLIDCVRHHVRKDFLLLGAIVGAAFLMKFSFYIWFIAIAVILFFLFFLLFLFSHSISKKNIISNLLLYIVGFYMIAGVYYVRNYFFYGNFFLTNAGWVTFEAAVNPYPSIQSDAYLTTYNADHLLDPSKSGTGTIYSLPIVTFFNVKPFLKYVDSPPQLDYLKNDVEFLRLWKRASGFLKLLKPSEDPENLMGFYMWQYGTNINGRKWFDLAASKYKKMAFSVDLYRNTLFRMWDYITYPAFGRFTYYYKFAQTETKYSNHYINPLFIFFEHYIMLFFTLLGTAFYFLFILRKKTKISVEVFVLATLSFLHLLGFSLLHIPEARYTFLIIPNLFLIASYGFIELTEHLRIFLEHWN